jgi:hypothetical protein
MPYVRDSLTHGTEEFLFRSKKWTLRSYKRQNQGDIILDNICDNNEACAGYRKVFSSVCLFSCHKESLYFDHFSFRTSK